MCNKGANRFLLQVAESSVVVWCIGGHGSDHTSTLVFLDGKHWQDIDELVTTVTT